jgi:group I intron endonuclease
MFDVYCHTSPSGKRYVGQSHKGMAARWREHVAEARSGSDRLLCRAIRKYGADAFRHELLAQCDTQAGAHASERRWIAQRGTMAPAGYNATAGGEGVVPADHVREKWRASWTAERRAQHSERTREQNAGNDYGTANRGRAKSASAREVMSAAALAMPTETRAKIDAARRGCTHGPDAKTRRPRSAEVRAKISAARRGKPWTAAQHAARAKKAG